MLQKIEVVLSPINSSEIERLGIGGEHANGDLRQNLNNNTAPSSVDDRTGNQNQALHVELDKEEGGLYFTAYSWLLKCGKKDMDMLHL